MSNRFERGESYRPKTPEMQPPLYDHPVWWHHHGVKMQVVESEFEGELLIRGSAAEVKISRMPEEKEGRGWNVDWKVKHTRNCYAQGRTEWQDDELSGAFGLINSTHYFGQHVIDRFGGESAEQGGYIRWGDFLNIPGPGTGHDYDPNVSILLTDEMREAAMKFKMEAVVSPNTIDVYQNQRD